MPAGTGFTVTLNAEGRGSSRRFVGGKVTGDWKASGLTCTVNAGSPPFACAEGTICTAEEAGIPTFCIRQSDCKVPPYSCMDTAGDSGGLVFDCEPYTFELDEHKACAGPGCTETECCTVNNFVWKLPTPRDCPTACGLPETQLLQQLVCQYPDGSHPHHIPEAEKATNPWCTGSVPDHTQTCPPTRSCVSGCEPEVRASEYR